MKKLRITSVTARRIWILFGAILLLTMSLFFQWVFNLSWYSENYLPGFPFILSAILNYFFDRSSDIFLTLMPLSIIVNSVFPLFFFIFASLKARHKYLFPLFSTLVTACMFFDIYWFNRGWKYGVNFQGINFIHHSILKNVICFLAIYFLMGIYYKSRKIVFLHAAILLFCVTISIVAFPWLGETI